MKKLLLAATIATALMFGAHAFAEDTAANTAATTAPATEDYGPGTEDPNASPKAKAAVSVSPTTTYDSAGGKATGLTLGQLLARHIKDADLSDFKKALEIANIDAKYDTEKGYTVFAPVNGEFDAAKHPVEYYIVNDRFTFDLMTAAHDTITNMHGDRISLNRVGTATYYYDDLLVNGVDRHADGIIYTVGGHIAAYHL